MLDTVSLPLLNSKCSFIVWKTFLRYASVKTLQVFL